MKEDIKIQSTKSGSTSTRTISDVNPAATNLQLATFGTMINDLTTNTYVKTDRVTTVNCDTEPGGGVKPTPTITLSRDSMTVAEVGNGADWKTACTITTTGDGNLYIRPATLLAANNAFPINLCTDNGTATFKINRAVADIAQNFYVGITEGTNYAATEVLFTITA